MTLSELKEQNPALHAQCVAAGIAEGVAQERERVLRFLPKHVTNSIAKYAVQCVKDGSPMGDIQKSRYWSMQITADRCARKQHADAEYVADGIESRFGVDSEHRKY